MAGATTFESFQAKMNRLVETCGKNLAACPKLHPLAETYWPKSWKIFEKLRQPDGGNLKRPPIG